MKPAFFQVGKRLINRYEVREVCLDTSALGVPTATVTYKDATKVTVKGARVPLFAAWILDKEVMCVRQDLDRDYY